MTEQKLVIIAKSMNISDKIMIKQTTKVKKIKAILDRQDVLIALKEDTEEEGNE